MYDIPTKGPDSLALEFYLKMSVLEFLNPSKIFDAGGNFQLKDNFVSNSRKIVF